LIGSRDSFTEIAKRITVAGDLGDGVECRVGVQKYVHFVGCVFLRRCSLSVMKIIVCTLVFFTRLVTRTKEFNLCVSFLFVLKIKNGMKVNKFLNSVLAMGGEKKRYF